jgi:hypothetical protein
MPHGDAAMTDTNSDPGPQKGASPEEDAGAPGPQPEASVNAPANAGDAAPTPRRGGVGTGQAEQGGRSPKGMTRRKFLGGLAAIAGAVATGGVATYFATRGSEANNVNNNVSPSITGGNPNPTEIPTVAPGTATPTFTNTPEAAPTPTAINVEAPVIAGEVNKPEIRRILDKYYIPVGDPVHTYGNVSLALSKAVQERAPCELNANVVGLNCPIKEPGLRAEIKDAEERLHNAVDLGMLEAWGNLQDKKQPNQLNLVVKDTDTVEQALEKVKEFQKRIAEGEDFSFPIQGYDGKPELYTKPIRVNPAKGIIRVALPSRDGTFITVNSNFGISYTIIDGQLVIGTYAGSSEGVAFEKITKPDGIALGKINSSDIASMELTVLGDKTTMAALQKQSNYSGLSYLNLENRRTRMLKILIPGFLEIPFNQYIGVFSYK